MSLPKGGFTAAVPSRSGRPTDLICIGRGIADLYADQLGGRLEDAISFSAYIGGSATNICVGVQRLGLQTGMILRVGDDHMGRLVRETLERNGIDVSHVISDPTAPTPLCILGVRDSQTFPRDLFTTGGAYLNLVADDLRAETFRAARALLINGSFFATDSLRAASLKAIKLAKEAGCAIALDIDYRPALWGLVGHGDGEAAYVASQHVTDAFKEFLPYFDLIVGTEEEIAIVGGARCNLTAVQHIRAHSEATIVLKRGPAGCVGFEDAIPDDIEQGLVVPGFRIEVMNTAGAGDSFMAGLLAGWLKGDDLRASCRLGNACGAINVARHGCSDSAPSDEEVSLFMGENGISKPDSHPVMRNLHGLLGRQAKPLPRTLLDAGQGQVSLEEASHALQTGAVDGVILPVCDSFARLAPITGKGYWLARAVTHGTDLADGIRLAREIRSWPREHILYLPVREADEAEGMVALAQLANETRHEYVVDLRPATDPVAVIAALFAQDMRPEWWIIGTDQEDLRALVTSVETPPRGVIRLD